jgi:hypothetical protein
MRSRSETVTAIGLLAPWVWASTLGVGCLFPSFEGMETVGESASIVERADGGRERPDAETADDAGPLNPPLDASATGTTNPPWPDPRASRCPLGFPSLPGVGDFYCP